MNNMKKVLEFYHVRFAHCKTGWLSIYAALFQSLKFANVHAGSLHLIISFFSLLIMSWRVWLSGFRKPEVSDFSLGFSAVQTVHFRLFTTVPLARTAWNSLSSISRG